MNAEFWIYFGSFLLLILIFVIKPLREFILNLVGGVIGCGCWAIGCLGCLPFLLIILVIFFGPAMTTIATAIITFYGRITGKNIVQDEIEVIIEDLIKDFKEEFLIDEDAGFFEGLFQLISNFWTAIFG